MITEDFILGMACMAFGWMIHAVYRDVFDLICQKLQKRKEGKPILKCLITQNECGTDTWSSGHPCHCENCKKWLEGKP